MKADGSGPGEAVRPDEPPPFPSPTLLLVASCALVDVVGLLLASYRPELI